MKRQGKPDDDEPEEARVGWGRRYRHVQDPFGNSAVRFRKWSKARLAHLAAIESKIGQEAPNVLG
jgi:hypothetical protein